MPIVPVLANDELLVHALLDPASTNTFCSKQLAERLGVKGKVVSYSLNTLSKGSECKTSEIITLKLSPENGGEGLVLHGVIVADSIPFRCDPINVRNYQHLRNLPVCEKVSTVDLLIGQDNAEALLPLETRKGKRGDPFATRTLFGWSINGSVLSPDVTGRRVVAHFINVNSLEDQIENLWKLEGEGLGTDTFSWTSSERQVIELWDSTVKRVNSHYELPIPWKTNIHVPNNLSVAHSRLRSLLSSLNKRNLRQLYDSEIRKLLENNYAEIIPGNENSSSESCLWYLPHQAVVNPKKPNRVRVVFDCASKYQGQSLNEKCLQGPDLNNKLIHVLTRFREHEYAFTADIESMYYQVVVPPVDRDVLRFLWVDGDDNIVHYRMTRHVFGGVWSPCAAIYALRRTTIDNPDFDPIVLQTILESFYVDDCLKSLPTEDQLATVIQGVKHLLHLGGFNLTKFNCNRECLSELVAEHDISADVMKSIPESSCKVLGVQWNIADDVFHFEFKGQRSDQVTRRSILSTIASSFDPLGLVGPVLVTGKLIFQECTRLKLGWDDAVPYEIRNKWLKWLDSLTELCSVKIPRCIKPEVFNDRYVQRRK